MTMAVTAAALAPELMPMTSGLASGFRSMVWNSAPASPKAIPIMVPVTARGSLFSITMKLAPGIFAPPLTWLTTMVKRSGMVTV